MEVLLLIGLSVCLCGYGIRRIWRQAHRRYELRKAWISIIVIYDDLANTYMGYPENWTDKVDGLDIGDISENSLRLRNMIGSIAPDITDNLQKHYLNMAYHRIDEPLLRRVVLRHKYMSSKVNKDRVIADEASRKYNSVIDETQWRKIKTSAYYKRCLEYMQILNKNLEELNAREYLR